MPSRYVSLFQFTQEPIGIVLTICQQPVGLWQWRHQSPSTDVVADVSSCEKQPDRTTKGSVTERSFKIQTIFLSGQSDGPCHHFWPKTRRRAMCIEVGGIDHQHIGFFTYGAN